MIGQIRFEPGCFSIFFFNPTLAIGGDELDLIYEVQPQIEYKSMDYMVRQIGYRRLYYDIKVTGANSMVHCME
jgi:hypothetical protein